MFHFLQRFSLNPRGSLQCYADVTLVSNFSHSSKPLEIAQRCLCVKGPASMWRTVVSVFCSGVLLLLGWMALGHVCFCEGLTSSFPFLDMDECGSLVFSACTEVRGPVVQG